MRPVLTGLAARDAGVAELCAAILPAGYEVVLSNTATATVDLAASRSGTDPDASHPPRWIYGSATPDHLSGRSSKVQVHDAFDPREAPDWFDHGFPRHVREYAIPGYSCFSRASLSGAAHTMLGEYRRVRLKDPSGTSGEGQTVVGTVEQIESALDTIADEMSPRYGMGSAEYLAAYGYIVEADLDDVDACSITVTRTPDGLYSALGHQVELEVPVAGGDVVSIYGGTSSVVVRGEPACLSRLPHGGVTAKDPAAPGHEMRLTPTHAVVTAAQRYIEGMRSWEREGVVKTRANVDVISGTLTRRDGTRYDITAAVEDSGRPGGASPAELMAIKDLRDDPDLPYSVRSTRHAVDDAARLYSDHAGSVPGSRVFWDGVDQGWEGRYVFIGAF